MIAPILSNSSELIPYGTGRVVFREYCPQSLYRTYYVAFRTCHEQDRLYWAITLDKVSGIKHFMVNEDGKYTDRSLAEFLEHLREYHPDDLLLVVFHQYLLADEEPSMKET